MNTQIDLNSRSNQSASLDTTPHDDDIRLLQMDDDGFGAASRSVEHRGYREYDPAIATCADDGFGAAIR